MGHGTEDTAKGTWKRGQDTRQGDTGQGALDTVTHGDTERWIGNTGHSDMDTNRDMDTNGDMDTDSDTNTDRDTDMDMDMEMDMDNFNGQLLKTDER
jgi:hypothetical protein